MYDAFIQVVTFSLYPDFSYCNPFSLC